MTNSAFRATIGPPLQGLHFEALQAIPNVLGVVTSLRVADPRSAFSMLLRDPPSPKAPARQGVSVTVHRFAQAINDTERRNA